jgi:hypothetical protein
MSDNEKINSLLDAIVQSPTKVCLVIDKDHARFQDWHYNEATWDREYEKDRVEVDGVLTRFKEVFQSAVKYWSACLGPPLQSFENWEREKPAWAGGLYARWDVNSDFYTIFMSWENPEDPFFLVAAKAPISEFNSEPGDYSNPWDYKWGE